VLRDAFAEVSELVLAEVAVKQTVTRELAGYLGGVAVRVDTVGVRRLGVDVSRARVAAVDHDAKVVTVDLPPVEVLHAGLDHDATVVNAYTTGLWPLSLAPSPEADLLATALHDASRRLLRTPHASYQTIDVEAALRGLVERWLGDTGWSIRFAPLGAAIPKAPPRA